MRETVERITAMALERFGEGELLISQLGEVFWSRPDGHRIPLGYTVDNAHHWLITLSGPLRPSPDSHKDGE